MLGSLGIDRVPKVITIRVNRGEGLQIIQKPDSKPKKYVPKWKVVFTGGKHKLSSDPVLAPNGNPIWNYEVTLKLVSKSDPVSIKIKDSDDHHVGQVIIPLVTMLPRPANPNERPTDPSRMQVADLEPTKKVSNPAGRIFYWIWVEEYRTVESDAKSSKGSVLSLNSKHRISLGRHRSSKAGSVADSLNYSGSVLSVGSSQMEGGDKKKPWYKRRLHKTGSKSAIRPNPADGSMSMTNVYEAVNRPSIIYNRPAPSMHNGAGSFDDHDGSILGANSDMTNSDLYSTGFPQRSPTNSQVFGGGGRAYSVIASNPMQSGGGAGQPISQSDVMSMRNELLGMAPAIKPPLDPYVAAPKPRLLGFSPTSCLTSGGVQVTVDCVGVTEGMTRHGAVLVDGQNVPRQDWYFKESGGQSQLFIHMPERPTGQCWIELETMHNGRLRCPQQFTYMPVPKNTLTEQRPDEAEEDSFSSSPADTEDSDVDGTTHMGRDTVSTIVPNPNALSHAPGPPSDLQATKTGPRTSTVADSGLGSPLPSSSFDPKPAELNGKSKVNGAQGPPSTKTNGSAELYDPFEQQAQREKKSSARGGGSGTGVTSKNPLDESFKMENEGLRVMLKEANETIGMLRKQNVDLEQKLAVQVVEVDRLSRDLCNLRNRLLEDNLTEYLRK